MLPQVPGQLILRIPPGRGGSSPAFSSRGSPHNFHMQATLKPFGAVRSRVHGQHKLLFSPQSKYFRTTTPHPPQPLFYSGKWLAGRALEPASGNDVAVPEQPRAATHVGLVCPTPNRARYARTRPLAREWPRRPLAFSWEYHLSNKQVPWLHRIAASLALPGRLVS